jgi:lysozyme family protein
LEAEFYAATALRDNSPVSPGAHFYQIWFVKNPGPCDWWAGVRLVYVAGDQFRISDPVPIAALGAGGRIPVRVEFTAPGSPGTYSASWQLQSPEGALFGPKFFVRIIVPEPTPTQQAPAAADWGAWYHLGNHGPVVSALQYLLRAHGYELDVDGTFGSEVDAAVRAFQTAEGLIADGIVGPQTWAALVRDHTLDIGDSHDAIRAAQEMLHSLYGYDIKVDGLYSRATRVAVRDFQRTHGLVEDGIVGPATWAGLVSGP